MWWGRWWLVWWPRIGTFTHFTSCIFHWKREKNIWFISIDKLQSKTTMSLAALLVRRQTYKSRLTSKTAAQSTMAESKWSFQQLLCSLKFFFFYKTKRLSDAVCLFSNISQRKSNCDRNISNTLSCTLCATFLISSHFDIISYLDTWQHVSFSLSWWVPGGKDLPDMGLYSI